ncbi:MAG: prepilin-type N-terminal cleavage/methylation domain-containing protein [Lachnospiraceae bacterium]|nr:prepilin-type N-terminal cleavage/methylation domain-containing protein [Lachnospiraceae bacterium]
MKAIKNDKGFTLLELLIAVIILGIVIVPMLHSFTSSHRINAKSKQYMRATTLAQDEMEIFEKEKIEDLTDGAKFPLYSITFPDPLDPNDEGIYIFEKSEVSNDSSGSSAARFDVKVTLDPERKDSAARYYNQNNEALFYMNSMGAQDSGSYVETVRNASSPKSYQDTINSWFKTNRLLSGIGSTWNEEMFGKNLARRVTLKIYQETTTKTVTKAKVTYEYICVDGAMSSGYQRYTEETIIFDNTWKLDEDGNPIDLGSIYLFYAPRYEGYSPAKTIDYSIGGELVHFTTGEDWIVVDNEAELPIDIYVIRQDILKEGSITEYVEIPVAYQPKLEVYDGLDGDGKPAGHYYTNLNLGPASGLGIGQPVKLNFHDIGDPYRVFSDYESNTVIDPQNIDASADGLTEVKDRIYTMTVQVYEHGADQSTQSPIVTMTGSKLD